MNPSKQQKNRFWFLLCLFFFFLTPAGNVSASQQLPEGIVIGDDKGITVQPDGTYLMDIRGILPGDSYDVTISLMNVDEKGQPYELFFWIDPPKQIEGPINFAEALSMTMTYQDQTIYNGIVAGTGTPNLQKEEYSLGIYRPGDSKALKVAMRMDSKYTKEDFIIKSVTENVWHFRAIRKDEPTNPSTTEPPTSSGEESGGGKKPVIKFPQTGEEWRDTLLYLSIGILLIVGVILFWHRKRQQDKEGGVK